MKYVVLVSVLVALTVVSVLVVAIIGPPPEDELPGRELSRELCEERSDVKPGNIVVFEGLTPEQIQECIRLLSR